MFAYKTNSPDYLDYVASVKTRQQILADPDLCLLLQNPYIKDNMQIALRWNKAKHGSYQDKYDFMEYLMCNGPELDVDTILHYRMKAYNDPICTEIAYSYLSDVSYISEVRKTKYNKESDECFKNPCFYMGKFSTMMGNCGDTENTRTAFNCIGRWWKAKWGNGKEQLARKKQQAKTGQISQQDVQKQESEVKAKQDAEEKTQQEHSVPGTSDIVQGGSTEPSGKNDTPQSPPPPGFMRKALSGVLHPKIKQGWGQWWAQVCLGNEAFSEDLMNCTNTALVAEKVGDAFSEPISQMLDMVTKANVKRQLGDCSRLWSHVRRFRLFSSDNKYGPVVAKQIVGDTNVSGEPQRTVNNPRPTAGESAATLDNQSTPTVQQKTNTPTTKNTSTTKESTDSTASTTTGQDGMPTISEVQASNYQSAVPVSDSGVKLPHKVYAK